MFRIACLHNDKEMIRRQAWRTAQLWDPTRVFSLSKPPSNRSFILTVHAPFLTNPQSPPSPLLSLPSTVISGSLPRLLSGRGHLPRYTNFHILTSPPHAAAAHPSFSGFLEVQKMNGTAGAGLRVKAYQCVPRFYSRISAGSFAR